eukprot:CAMPEP_0115267952 /NCGR_PEP_ID=MMETSP0270-20121206/52261_1 /TAXON_ID=71861 /ORGANISM="Scrippsiella trochoidea, Strain CCMP3099" /LENGTH=31 /DNA_ID= /DNA_START= /DNA_END= /DNA_ORIENTATION=
MAAAAPRTKAKGTATEVRAAESGAIMKKTNE